MFNFCFLTRNVKKQFLFFVALVLPINVFATPNVVGTYTGTVSGTEFSPSAPFSDFVEIIIDNQSGTSIKGKISFSSINLSTTFSGSVQGGNTIDVIFEASSTAAAGGGFAGTFTGSTLIIPNGVGSLVINGTSPIKGYDVGGILNFSGADSIDAENASGTTLKSSGTIRSEVNSIVSPVTNHLKKTLLGKAGGLKLNETGFLFEAKSGLNAGDMPLANLGVWLNYNYISSENDFSRTSFESDSHSVVGGVDYAPVAERIYGVAFSYEISETDTLFNSGNLQTEGFSIVPYIGMLINENWSLDASIGMSWLTNDQYRTVTATNIRVTSAPDSKRIFFSSNLNGVSYIDNWILGGRVGLLFAESETEDFLESDGTLVAKRDTMLGEVIVGGDIAYSFGEFEPFLSIIYEYDFIFDEITLTAGAQPANDRDDILFSSGFRYFGTSGLTANLEYRKRLLREEFEEDSLNITLRYDW